jgi:hypothetical protein
MSDTRTSLKQLSGPAGILTSVILAVAALATSLRPSEAPATTERISKLETETKLFKEWLERVEKKLDRVIERKEKQ